MYICPGLPIEERIYLDIIMAQQMTWEEIEPAIYAMSDEELDELEALLYPERAEQQAQEMTWEEFEEAIYAMSDEELAELEALLYPERAEQQALIDEFFEPTPFERQRDGVQGWLHGYKKTIPIPELHKDLREFHNFIRPEVMEILENESKALGPIVVRITKETNEGIVVIKYYTVQREPILVNAFNPEIVTQHLNALADAQEEALVNHNQNGLGFIIDSMEAAYLRILNYDPLPGGS